jgi:hypothetical protein
VVVAAEEATVAAETVEIAAIVAAAVTSAGSSYSFFGTKFPTPLRAGLAFTEPARVLRCFAQLLLGFSPVRGILCFFVLCFFTEATLQAARNSDELELRSLLQIAEAFDGGSVCFDFETAGGICRVVLTDQILLAEVLAKDPESQIVSLREPGKKQCVVAVGSPEEIRLIRGLDQYVEKTTESIPRIKAEKLLLILRDRKTPAVSKDFWYRQSGNP